MTLVIELPAEKEAQLQQAAVAEGVDISTFVRDALEERLRQRVAVRPPSEAQLLAQISEGFPDSFWSRYRTLIARRRAETLTPKEQQELIALSERLEARSVERLVSLTELARRRDVSVRTLMDELGLHPMPVE